MCWSSRLVDGRELWSARDCMVGYTRARVTMYQGGYMWAPAAAAATAAITERRPTHAKPSSSIAAWYVLDTHASTAADSPCSRWAASSRRTSSAACTWMAGTA